LNNNTGFRNGGEQQGGAGSREIGAITPKGANGNATRHNVG